jgi:uncharacterized membrane protein YcaP (DUF421 family)
MELILRWLGSGREATDLTVVQVCLRAVVVFFAALVIVRLADKRFFAKKTAFDVILGFILASMLARAINGSEQLGPTIASGAVLAMLHRLLGRLACRFPVLSGWVKGHSETLVENGEIDREKMKRHHIGEDDLQEEFRLNGVESVSGAKLARLERSGEISVIPK